MLSSFSLSIKDENAPKAVNWQDLGYIYKRQIAIEMCKVPFYNKSRIAHLYSVGREHTRTGHNSE